MKKETCFRYVEENMSKFPVQTNIQGETYTLAGHRRPKVTYRFEADNLPDVIRLGGSDNFAIDVPMTEIKEAVLSLSTDEVLTLGRAPECDKQVANFDDNRVSRMQVILQRVKDEVVLINLGHYGTVAMKETQFGLQELAPLANPELWLDYEARHGTITGSSTPRKKPWWQRIFS